MLCIYLQTFEAALFGEVEEHESIIITDLSAVVAWLRIQFACQQSTTSSTHCSVLTSQRSMTAVFFTISQWGFE